MKQYLPFLIICAGAVLMPPGVNAWTMIVTKGSSEKEELNVSTETRITFSDDLSQMIVSPSGSADARTFDVDDVENVVFTIVSSVDCVSPQLDDLIVSNSGGIVNVTGADVIEYTVWDTSGTLVADGRGELAVTIDFTSRAPGIYIIKVNNRTLKFINR